MPGRRERECSRDRSVTTIPRRTSVDPATELSAYRFTAMPPSRRRFDGFTASVEEVLFSLHFLFVCLLISRIMQKLLDRFSQNSMEKWRIGHGRNDYISPVIQIWIREFFNFTSFESRPYSLWMGSVNGVQGRSLGRRSGFQSPQKLQQFLKYTS